MAAALERYNLAQLIGFAWRLNSDSTGQGLAYSGLWLDQMDDWAFAEVGLSEYAVIALRERFAAWHRHIRIAY